VLLLKIIVQMYKVFINDKLLFLTNQLVEETDFQIFLLESVNIQKIIGKYFDGTITKAVLYHPDEKVLMQTLKEKLIVNKAGGGKVYNQNGEILFIFRNGKWDLPKGGIEKNESIEDTAIREVEEETGCKNLKIVRRLEKTFHIFKRNGEYRLKITYWFEMKTNYTGVLTGQLNEGIEKVQWVKPEEVIEKLENSYENIKLLF